MSAEEAKKKLELARKQLHRVQTASWDPQDDDYEVAVNWAFYAYENAVVAGAEKLGVPWKKTHVSKAEVAQRLHEDGHVSTDISDLIEELNELRKDVQYGELGPSLRELDLERLATELEGYIDEIAAIEDETGED